MKMIVGVPKETKKDEHRVAMLPAGVHDLVAAGHRVFIQSSAGLGSGITDSEYLSAGAEIVDDPQVIFSEANLIVKVKEPLPHEAEQLREGQILFTYLHLAASEELTRILMKSGCTALAYETLRGADRSLPLLTPMSEIAGRMSIQEGAKYLERPQGGRGVLLSGVPGVKPAHVVVLGAGIVGKNAAKIAAGFGADVVVLDLNVQKLREVEQELPPNVSTLFSNRLNLLEQISSADLVIGAVLVPGGKAPRLISAEDLKLMKPGAVIVDVCIDQGGCLETSRPTTHSDPVYVVDEIVHYCVTNMPGAVSRTSTFALCNVTFPYVLRLANQGLEQALKADAGFQEAVNLRQGKICYQALAESLNLPFTPYV